MPYGSVGGRRWIVSFEPEHAVQNAEGFMSDQGKKAVDIYAFPSVWQESRVPIESRKGRRLYCAFAVVSEGLDPMEIRDGHIYDIKQYAEKLTLEQLKSMTGAGAFGGYSSGYYVLPLQENQT